MKSNPASLKDEYTKKREAQELEKKMAAAAVTVGVAAAIYPASKVEETQSKAFDKSLYRVLNTDPNTPLNKDTLLVAHNAGTNEGSTIPGFENQQMSTDGLLDLTARINGGIACVQYPVAVEDGNWVVNHGGVSDGSKELAFQSQLDEIKAWEEENPGSIVIIQVSDQTGVMDGTLTSSEDKALFASMVDAEFGNKAFSYSDLQKYQGKNDTSDMPSKEWLVKHGYTTIVITGGLDGYESTIPAVVIQQGQYVNADKPFQDKYMQVHDESRAPLLYFINGIEKLGIIDTKDADRLFSRPGMVKLDHLQPNDPRLVDPSNRDQLIDDPDMSAFGGLVQLDRSEASIAAFTLGLTLDETSAAFAIANALYKSYLNNNYIKNIDKTITSMVNAIDLAELELFKKNNKKYKDLEGEALIEAYCRTKVYAKITRDTMLAGLTATASLSSSIYSTSLLFPPVAPIIATAGIIAGGVGALGTAGGVAFNRYKLGQEIDHAIKINQELMIDKVEQLKSPSKDFDMMSALEDRQAGATLDRASDSLTTASLLFRLTAMGKYAIPAAQVVAGGVSAGYIGALSLINIVKDARERQKNYENLPKYTAKLLMSDIYKAKFLFFGDSKLDEYVKQTCDLDGVKVRDYLDGLDDSAFTKLVTDCSNHYLKEDIDDYLKKNKLMNDEEGINAYIKDRISKDVFRSSLLSSIIATTKLSAAVSTAGFAVPTPASPLVVLGGAGIMAAGVVAAPISAKLQERKFLKGVEKLLDADINANDHTEEAGLVRSMQKLKNKVMDVVNSSRDISETASNSSGHSTDDLSLESDNKAYDVAAAYVVRNPKFVDTIHALVDQAELDIMILGSNSPNKGGDSSEKSVVISHNDNLFDYRSNLQELIRRIEKGGVSSQSYNSVRIEQNDYSIMDVALLGNIIKHNSDKKNEAILIPEENKRSSIYQDAMLYNAAKAKGIAVVVEKDKSTVKTKDPMIKKKGFLDRLQKAAEKKTAHL